MPGGDATGPLGKGPYTGRGINNSNQGRRGYNRANSGRGLGRSDFYNNDNKESLEEEKKVLENRINTINSQIKEK